MHDELCLSGEVAWARLRVPPPETELSPRARAGNIGLFPRGHAAWLIDAHAVSDEPPFKWAHLSTGARAVAEVLHARGAAFVSDLAQALGQSPSQIEDALGELVRTRAAPRDDSAALSTL